VDEQEDFESACKKHGRMRKEITAVFEVGIPTKEGVSHIPGQVAVAANLTVVRLNPLQQQ
jgi:hypothetical protein